MATTTNFGWETPDDTDLVKDGAAAMRTLGNAIDTSFVDLKGGTTGQILTKASNTDLDYTWTSPNPGDITAVTAGTGITGGGTSGDVTVSFDVANYGGGQFAAGKNKIINGDFGIWQRGTSFSAGVGTYNADRWYSVANQSGGTVTYSQQTFTPASAPVAGYEGQYYLRCSTSSPTGATFNVLSQKIEDVRTFAGQTVTLSFWAKADTTRSITPKLIQNFGSGGSAEVATTGTAISLTTSWTRYSQTFTVPSISGKTIGSSSFISVDILQQLNATITQDYWGFQLEAGSTASPFQTATGTKQGELAACQRYYQRFNYLANGVPIATMAQWSTTNGTGLIFLPTTMRTMPQSLDYSGIQFDRPGAGVVATTAVTLGSTSNSGNTQIFIQATAASGLTAGTFGYISATTSSSYIGFSAEL